MIHQHTHISSCMCITLSFPPTLSYWGDLLPLRSPSVPAANAVATVAATVGTSGRYLAAAVLLERLLPGQQDLVSELLECIVEGMSWKRVG